MAGCPALPRPAPNRPPESTPTACLAVPGPCPASSLGRAPNRAAWPSRRPPTPPAAPPAATPRCRF